MRFSQFSLLATLTLVGGACPAHTDAHSLSGFVDGLGHPLTGVDHILAMLGVGLWAAILPGQAWRLPAAFMILMGIGGALGAAGLPSGGSEAGIAGSVLILGLLVSNRLRPAFPLAITATGVFGLFHGFAHGAEIPEGSAFAAYALGFVAATGVLHLAGILLGRALLGAPALYRALGAAIGVWGVYLLAQGV
jgi:urease accessory protein